MSYRNGASFVITMQSQSGHRLIKCLSLLIGSYVLSILPGKSHGWRNLIGYSPRGHKESDMTERLHFTSLHFMGSYALSIFLSLGNLH